MTHKVSLERQLTITYREHCTLNTVQRKSRRRKPWDKLTFEEQEFAQDLYKIFKGKRPFKKRLEAAAELTEASATQLSSRTRAYAESLASQFALYLSSQNSRPYKALSKRVVKYVHSLDDITEHGLRERLSYCYANGERLQNANLRLVKKNASLGTRLWTAQKDIKALRAKAYDRLKSRYVRLREMYTDEQEKVADLQQEVRSRVKKSTYQRAKTQARRVPGLLQAIDHLQGEYDKLKADYRSADAVARRVPGLETDLAQARADANARDQAIIDRDRTIADLAARGTGDTAHLREAAYHLVEQGEYEAGIRMYERIADRVAGREQGELLRNIALAYFRWGASAVDKTKITAARDYYTRAQGLLPGDPYVRNGLEACREALV